MQKVFGQTMVGSFNSHQRQTSPDTFALALVKDQHAAVEAAAEGDSEIEYKFQGRHMMASFMGCDSKFLLDTETLLKTFTDAANATGATVLDACSYVFPNGGVTAVLLLSESHASIHTYPESGSCFVDLFTCGDTVDQAKFNEVMYSYLRPAHVNQNIFNREQTIEAIDIH